ncbi:MAG TPA: DUF402 domain-containing protein [Polyangia bacterium]
MDVNALPQILETKRTLCGADKTFPCRVLARGPGAVTVLFISDRTYSAGDLTLPVGTVTFGHFWTDRPYNVYHWLAGEDGRTLAHYVNLSDQTTIDEAHLGFRDLAVDVLARPGRPPIILDEDELPPDLDPGLRVYLDRGVAQVKAELPTLIPVLEREADRLWPQVFGTQRA